MIFSAVCTVDNGVTPAFDNRTKDGATLDNIEFNRGTVMRAIKRLKNNTASGPDGMPPIMYKNLAQSLAEPLALIFESFMSVGRIPDEWKRAIITPIYKSGLASDVSNYRPIALTCVACKIMERVIVSDMLHFLREQRLITKQQYGFIARRSTTLNLLDALNDWSLAINNKFSVAVAYIDYAKAFDTVSPPKLCHKLEAYGISGNLLSWIADLLCGRSQQTRVGSALSDIKTLTSGVIQGSCLGPLLFVLYVNDVANIFCDGIVCKMYADDIKLYTIVKTDDDSLLLQDALDKLQDWSHAWQLNISHKKCMVLELGSKNNLN